MKVACYYFMDAGRIYNMPESETKDFIIHDTTSSMSITSLTAYFAPKCPWQRDLGGSSVYGGFLSQMKNTELGKYAILITSKSKSACKFFVWSHYFIP